MKHLRLERFPAGSRIAIGLVPAHGVDVVEKLMNGIAILAVFVQTFVRFLVARLLIRINRDRFESGTNCPRCNTVHPDQQG